MKKPQIKIKKLLLILAAYSGLVAFLSLTDPTKTPVGWLIVPFFLMFLSLFLTGLFVFDWFRSGNQRSNRQITIAAIVALTPTLMLVLSSVDQLSMSDGFIIAILGIAAVFYTSKVSFQK